MKRATSKKAERRKKPRSTTARTTAKRQVSSSRAAKMTNRSAGRTAEAAEAGGTVTTDRDHDLGRGLRGSVEFCKNCEKDLSAGERALFVEEELGRIFCSEECIASYFGPEIERLEKEYFKRLSASDLASDERENLSHLRWITLQEPDEVWREKTLSGDFRYTLISEFQPGTKKVWCICICLFLRGEPSFLYLAFPTRNAAMVNHYRKGERVQWVKSPSSMKSEELAEYSGASAKGKTKAPKASKDEPAPMEGEDLIDGLATDGWTANETFLANMNQERSENDIPSSEFAEYQSCLEPCLENPDEVWSVHIGEGKAPKLYHFIKHYPEENSSYWYVIVARETDDDEQIEILEAFPTSDANLVDRYRCGEQEIGQGDTRPAAARIVH